LSLLYALAIDLHAFEKFSDLRNHLETAFWHEACALLTDADKDAMRGFIRSARDKLNSQWIRIPNAEHRAFHLTLFSRLNNPFVVGLLEAYWDAYDAVQLNSYADYDYLQAVWDYHERILNAICSGDYDTARALFIEHTQLLSHQPRMRDMKGDAASSQKDE
jgi:DNA-binding FadR family transcriptional regulator